jgi:hypothetical protein
MALPFTALDGYSVRDFLFDHAWHTADRAIETTMLSEVRGWNLGFAAWRDGVYRPISQHELARALFCNLANVVDDTNWLDGSVPFQSYCAFGDCENLDELPALVGESACSLDAQTGSSQYKLVIDANMHLDSSTRNYQGDLQTLYGSLDMTHLHTAQSGTTPQRPAGATVPATLASNVRTRIWNYGSNPHEAFENMCDVTNSEGLFLGHPRLEDGVTDNIAGRQARNACMMNGRGAQQPVQAKVGAGSWVDSARIWGEIAAEHPERISLIDVVQFVCEEGEEACASESGYNATLSEPGWGMAASCLWNPGWSTLATVSIAGANPASESTNAFCPAGSAWGSEYSSVGDDATVARYFECGEQIAWNNVDFRDCVEIAETAAPLRLSIKPEYAVWIPEGLVGRQIRAEMVATLAVSPADFPTSCAVASALLSGVYPSPNGDYLLTDVAKGSIRFMNVNHQWLDDAGSVVVQSGVPVELSCSTPWTLGEEDFASVRPKFRSNDQANALVSVGAVVPPNAKYAVATFEIPNAEGGGTDLWFPSGGSVEVSVSTWTSPSATPALSPDSVEVQFGGSPEPFGARADLPKSCRDSKWYISASWRANESGVGCYQEFSENTQLE